MKNLLFLLFLAIGVITHAQVSINTDGSLPDNSAMLDIKSTNKGILIPRMTLTQRNAIPSPANGLMVYQTNNSPGFYYNSGTGAIPAWVIAGTGSGWGLTGNSGTSAGTNFIGTTDLQPLRFRVNNAWAGEIHPTSGNIFLGMGAGQSNTIGVANTAIGEHSLFANTEINFTTAIGYYALASNITGYNNTGLGSYALTSNDVGYNNTAVGRNSLFANSGGIYNTATGSGALLSNISGSNNTAIGAEALRSNNAGSANTATGFQALYTNTTGSFNTANGYQALYFNNDGFSNTANGFSALGANTTGSKNTANGVYALFSNTTGGNNTANGFEALYSNTTGINNIANGFEALYSNTTGINNTANGYQALYSNTTGEENTANGYQALYFNNDGFSNTANGFAALGLNTYGIYNTANGWKALFNNTTGDFNIAIGGAALINNSTGDFNIAIGDNSGTALNFPNLFNTIGIGNDGSYQHGASNQVVIGNASMLVIAGKVGWSVLSDARVKNTVKEDVKGLDFILKLRPVTYHISNAAITAVSGSKETPDFPGKYDGEKVKYSGFIAQEVEQAAKAANYEFSGYDTPKNEWGLYTLKYAEFVVPLVKAVQELNVINEIQKATNDLQKAKNEELNLTIEGLIAQNEKLMQRIEKLENK